jgi:hypothetical protein
MRKYGEFPVFVEALRVAVAEIVEADRQKSVREADEIDGPDQKTMSEESRRRHDDFVTRIGEAFLVIFELEAPLDVPELPKVDYEQYQRDHPDLSLDEVRRLALGEFIQTYRLENPEVWHSFASLARGLLLTWGRFPRKDRRGKAVDPTILDALSDESTKPADVADKRISAILRDPDRPPLDRFWAARMVWTYREANESDRQQALEVFDELWPEMREQIEMKLRGDGLDDWEQLVVMKWVAILARENRGVDNKPQQKGDLAASLGMARQSDLNRLLQRVFDYQRALSSGEPLVIARAILARIESKRRKNAFGEASAPCEEFLKVCKSLVIALNQISPEVSSEQLTEGEIGNLTIVAKKLEDFVLNSSKKGFPRWLRRSVQLLADAIVSILA